MLTPQRGRRAISDDGASPSRTVADSRWSQTVTDGYGPAGLIK